MTQKNSANESMDYLFPRERYVPPISMELVQLIVTEEDAKSLITTTTSIEIDELHALIENSNNHHKTFIDNLELWKQFYNDRHIIIRNNILNPKLFTIIKFLLKQEKGEIFDYFHSEIIKTIKRAQVFVALEVKNSNENAQTNINKLLTNLRYHDDLAQYLSELEIKDTFGDIKQFSSKMVELYTTISLINLMYENFFDFEPKFVETTLEFITKSTISLQHDQYREHLMSNELINQYLKKIIPLKKFIGQNLADDELFKQIKSYQIKDRSFLTKMFKELSLDTILEIFEHNINNILIFFKKVDYIDEFEKECRFTNVLLNKMLNERKYTDLLELIIKDNQNTYWKKWINSYKYNQIILGSLNEPIFYMNSDMIKYLLTAKMDQNTRVSSEDIMEHTISQKYFRYECQYLIRKKDFLEPNFDIEGITSILSSLSPKTFTDEELEILPHESFSQKETKIMKRFSKGLDIDFDIAIDLLGKHLENKNRLSTISVYAIVRSIATEFQKQLGIDNNGIYYFKEPPRQNKIRYGTFYPGYLTISLNRLLIKKFLNYNLPLHERLGLLVINFHEIKHSKINQNKRDNNWDIDAYEMEREHIVKIFDAEFYDVNYKKTKEEISARISGYDYLLKFIETYFPQLLDKIQDEIINELEKEKTLNKEQTSERVMTFFKEQKIKFNIVFDALIRYNPNILMEHQILCLEYYPNGTPKTYEDIYLERTEENKDLIDGILMKRYPDTFNQVLNTNHTK